jgi:hypothetical protein
MKPEAAMSIYIEREARDCPHNTEVRANGRSLGGSRILYDYKILIDGEFRAIALGNGSGQRGFRLHDANRDPIILSKHQPHHLGAEIDRKDDIIPAISTNLDKIPTLDQLAANRAAKKQARNNAIQLEYTRRVAGWKRHYGVELHSALCELLDRLKDDFAIDSIPEVIAAEEILQKIYQETVDDVGPAPKIET